MLKFALSHLLTEGSRAIMELDNQKVKENLLRFSLGSDLVIYISRCVIGFLIGYTLYVSFPEHHLYWTLLSIILVISPEAKDSMRLATDRFKSNLIGSGIGLICFFIDGSRVYVILFGVVLSILVCYWLKLLSVARSAIVAMIIVLIYESEYVTWTGAVERFLSVALGCLIGLGITKSTSYLINYLRKHAHLPPEQL